MNVDGGAHAQRMPKQSQEQVLGIRNTLLTEELEKVVNKVRILW